MTQHIRVDDLGHETQFILVDHLVPLQVKKDFRQKLFDMALGYTKVMAWGGWRGDEEATWIYKVASLSTSQRNELIEFLLHNTGMKNIYVVLPGGLAQGYSLEHDQKPLTQVEQFQASRGRPYEPGCILDTLHGTRDTGWKG